MLPTTNKRRHARLRIWTAVLLLLATAGLHVSGFAPLDTLEARSFDWRQVLAGQRPVPGDVAIVAIDDASLATLGRWPWPRATLGRLVDRLNDLGARVIVLDALFPEPENPDLLRRLDDWAASQKTRPAEWQQLRSTLDGDAQLAAAIARHGRVILSLAFEPGSSPAASVTGAVSNAQRHLVRTVRSTTGQIPPMNLPRLGNLLTNIATIDAAAAAAGHIVMAPDADGVVRREALVMPWQEGFVPAADLQAAAYFLDSNQQTTGPAPLALNVSAYGITGVTVGQRELPTDELGRVVLHYYGPERSFNTFSAAQVLDGQTPATALSGKLVIVGATAQGIGDIRVTPWGPGFPGVEMRATAIQNLVSGDVIVRPQWMGFIDLLLLALLWALAFQLLRQSAMRRVLLGALALAVLYAAATFLAFLVGRIWLNLVYPTMLVLALALAELLIRYVTIDRQRRQVRHAFQHYLAPKLVDLVSENAGALKLGGERRELSMIFTDLAGFTNLCEHLPAERLVLLLRQYFERLIGVVHEHDGLVERIVGDGMVVFFNAPLDQPDHACRALRCALGMDAAAEALRAELVASGIDMGVTRIGVNTGEVSAGNFGSSTRFHYTAMGDAINVTARLETANRHLGTRICAARATLDRCTGIPWRPIGRLRVKGRGAIVEAGEPLDAQRAAEPVTERYRQAFAALASPVAITGDNSALEQFAALAREQPADPLVLLHWRRLQAGERSIDIEIGG